MMTKIKRIGLIVFFSLMVIMPAMAQTLTAKVNRSEVPQGETFMYILEYNGNLTGNPDFSALEKDFQIYNASSSYQHQNINGKVSQITEWQIALGAIKPGEFIIPAIKFANIESNPVKVKVVGTLSQPAQEPIAEDEATPDSTAANVLDIKIDNDRPYIQQQINYTITLTDTRNLQFESLQMMDDGSQSWIVKELKQPTVEITKIDGKQARVIKFYYALFPQKSGFLQTPEFRVMGYYLSRVKSPNNRMAGFAGFGFDDVFARKNPVVLATPKTQVEVRPVRQKNIWWLPAKQVELASDFEPKNPTFKVGEAVNRTIKLAASGVMESQLPEIKFPTIKGMKQYPAKPVTEGIVRHDEVIAVKTVSNVYIPTEAGNMTLPEIRINWFDVTDNQAKVATLPAINITVEPGEGLINTTEPEPTATDTKDLQSTPSLPQALPMTQAKPQINAYAIAVGAFVLGMLIMYLLLRPKHQRVNHKKEAIKALYAKDYRQARDELIKWGREFYKNPKIHNLADLAVQSRSKEFMSETDKIDSMLYSSKEVDFDAKNFIKVFERISKKNYLKKNNQAPLPNLYK